MDMKVLLTTFGMIFLGSIVIATSLTWNLRKNSEEIRNMAENIAQASFLKDQAFRFWATPHGGVYVPATDRTPPNPYLEHITDRDIEKPDGTKLTLMNPAYMLRQMMEEYSGLYGVKGRITSLKYLYEGNKPDEWETKAL